jgi:type III pantothenate kinase
MEFTLLLVIDVGNTNTVLGLMDGTRVNGTFRISTLPRTTDEYGVLLRTLLASKDFELESIEGAIISSVVPSILFNLEKACRRYLNIEALVVGRNLKTGMQVRTDNPREVGADRIVNAVSAYQTWGGPIVIVDFGTATTFDCVTADGAYVGGAIAPGLRIAEEALFSKTAKLPRVEVARPSSPIGTNTVHAMQSGLFYGYVGLVDGLARRCREALSPDAKVVATGGLSNLIGQACTEIDEVDATLTLRGLALLYERNQE